MTVAAVIQMTSGADRARNLTRAAGLIAEAAEQGAVLAVLPENFAFMGSSDQERLAAAEADGSGPVQDFLAREAAHRGIWLVGGTLPLLDADATLPAAACLVYDRAGRRVGRYDKIHLFDVTLPGDGESYRESATIRAGRAPLLIDTPCGRLGIAVCYDLRFPELFRDLQCGGADGFAVPAAFTAQTGRAHWEVLVRARAIENLGYVLAAAQSGNHPGSRQTYGNSLIVNAWGEILGRAPDGEGVVLAQLDLQKQVQIRERFPALAHRIGGAGLATNNDHREK